MRSKEDVPFDDGAFLSLKPPVVFLQGGCSCLVKNNIHEKSSNLREKKRQVASPGRLKVVALEAAIRVCRQLLWINTDFERNSSLPCEATKESCMVVYRLVLD